MSCEKYENLISLYLEDELDEEQKKDLEHHLTGCDSCKQQLEAIRLMQGIFRQEDKPIKINKMRTKIYSKIFRDLLIMFAGLVIIVSMVSVSGGLAQMFLLDRLSTGVGIFFLIGILLLIMGLIILLYDLFVDIIKIIFKK